MKQIPGKKTLPISVSERPDKKPLLGKVFRVTAVLVGAVGATWLVSLIGARTPTVAPISISVEPLVKDASDTHPIRDKTMFKSKLTQIKESNEQPLPVTNGVLDREARSLTKYYARFLNGSKLTAELKDQLMQIAAERAWLPEVRLQMLKSGELKSLAEADKYFADESAALDKEMRDLLGDEYPAFVTETQHIPIQRAINVFAAQMDLAHESLTADQQQTLVDAIWKRYQAAGVDIFYSDKYSRIDSPRDFINKTQSRSIADAEVLGDVAHILNAKQLTKLKQFQNAQIQHRLLSPKLTKAKAD